MKLPASMLTLNYIDLNWPQKQFSTNKQSYKWMYLSEIEYFKQAVNKGFLTFKVFKSFEKYFEAYGELREAPISRIKWNN